MSYLSTLIATKLKTLEVEKTTSMVTYMSQNTNGIVQYGDTCKIHLK